MTPPDTTIISRRRRAAEAMGYPPSTRWMTDHDVAEVIGRNIKTVRNWRMYGRGPAFYRIEGRVQYDPLDIHTLIEAAKRGHAA